MEAFQSVLVKCLNQEKTLAQFASALAHVNIDRLDLAYSLIKQAQEKCKQNGVSINCFILVLFVYVLLF